IPNSDSVPGYCYIICDLTDSIVGRCKYLDLTVSSDHLGYFGFHKQYKAYIEVISYDKLVNAAKERNRAFFDKLGLPAT
ncbi:MAG: ATP-binding protein, partial [Proteobacteria bacterium]|nr:ATP-binding protein [Pseudomonadota bacterium]